MGFDDVLEVEVLLAELVNRSAWRHSAVCGERTRISSSASGATAAR
jgi:hypothetical protein